MAIVIGPPPDAHLPEQDFYDLLSVTLMCKECPSSLSIGVKLKKTTGISIGHPHCAGEVSLNLIRMEILRKKNQTPLLSEAILGYVKSWTCGVLMNSLFVPTSWIYCALIWENDRAASGKKIQGLWPEVSERGVVEGNTASLNRAIVSGSSEFEGRI